MIESELEEVESRPGGWIPDLTMKQEQEEEKVYQLNNSKPQVTDESDVDAMADVAMIESEEVVSGRGGWMSNLKKEQEQEKNGNQSNRSKPQVIDESDDDVVMIESSFIESEEGISDIEVLPLVVPPGGRKPPVTQGSKPRFVR